VETIAGISKAPQYVTTVLHHGLTNVWGGVASWHSDFNSIVRTEVELFNTIRVPRAQGVGAAINSGFTKPGTYETANVFEARSASTTTSSFRG
jgi:hypothetical protein